jgi:DNA-directed RNA polymerase specialized sigma24 family protein
LSSAIALRRYDSGPVIPYCLEALATIDGRKSRLVELRYFGGLSVEEAAVVPGVSKETAKRDWKMARAWLYAELAGEQKPIKT